MAKDHIDDVSSRGDVLVDGHLRRPVGPAESCIDDPTDELEEHLSTLPSELLVEIFHSLDTLKQVELRRVCQEWNELLSIDKAYKHIQVSVKNENLCGIPCSCEFDIEHHAAGCVFKCLNSTTEWISLLDASFLQISSSVELIADIVAQSDKQRTWKRHLIVSNSSWEVSTADMEEMMEMMVSACSKAAIAFDYMIWKNCKVDFGYPRRTFGVSIAKGRVDLTAVDLESQVWSFLESNIPPLDVDGIARNVSIAVKNGRKKACNNFVAIIETFQSEDPRAANPYRGREWTVETLKDVDVAKLSKLTLAALDHQISRNNSTKYKPTDGMKAKFPC